jgi:hypothetical protein
VKTGCGLFQPRSIGPTTFMQLRFSRVMIPFSFPKEHRALCHANPSCPRSVGYRTLLRRAGYDLFPESRPGRMDFPHWRMSLQRRAVGDACRFSCFPAHLWRSNLVSKYCPAPKRGAKIGVGGKRLALTVRAGNQSRGWFTYFRMKKKVRSAIVATPHGPSPT